MGAPKKISDEQLRQIIYDYEFNDIPISHSAKKFGVAANTLYKRLSKIDYTLTRKGNRRKTEMPEWQYAQILAMSQSGLSIRAIHRKTGIGFGILRRMLKELKEYSEKGDNE